MPKDDTHQLRIYCICGQKMKVSPEMQGRPGKCVACRQKIRIPAEDEVPEGVNEIHLKDHPEFLRKTIHHPIRVETPAPAEPEPEVVRDDEETEQHRALPLDVLEPLRMLCSLTHKVERELALWEQYKEEGEEREKAERDRLNHQLERLTQARASLDEELRQRLMEAAIELAAVQEKIAEAGLAVRVGESDFRTYFQQVGKLRRRRDSLERRQENIRGWRSAKTPYEAGGYVDLDEARIPPQGFQVTLPTPVEDSQPLLEVHLNRLRDGFARRELAERKLAEMDTLAQEGHIEESGAAGRRAEHEAARLRANAEIWFCRERLGQLQTDYTGDIQSIEAQLDLVRSRLKVGEMGKTQFASQERVLLRAKTDLAKACNVVGRGLSANATHDVPQLRGTFANRLAGNGMTTPEYTDSWAAWAAALVLVLALLVPVAEGLSPLTAFLTRFGAAPELHWLVTGPLVAAAVACGAAFVPHQLARGVAFLILASLGFTAMAGYLHEMLYDPSPAGTVLRAGGALLLRPAVLSAGVGLALLAIASCVSLLPIPRVRLALPAVFAITAAAFMIIGSDMFGAWLPRPRIVPSSGDAAAGGYIEARVTVSNMGGRALHLAPNGTMYNAFVYALEQREAGSEWTQLEQPFESMTAGSRTWSAGESIPPVSVAPSDSVVFRRRLGPGEYRAVLSAVNSDWEVVKLFAVDPPARAPEELSAPERQSPNAAEPGGDSEPPSSVDDEGPSVKVVLSLIGEAEGRNTQFAMKVVSGETRESMENLFVGDEIVPGWAIAEFNPEQNTVTLSAEGEVLILRVGEPTLLPFMPEPAEEPGDEEASGEPLTELELGTTRPSRE